MTHWSGSAGGGQTERRVNHFCTSRGAPSAHERLSAKRRRLGEELVPGHSHQAHASVKPTPAHPALSELVSLLELVALQTIPMPNGVLGVAEVSKHIGFPVHRVYYIKEVPTGHSRGGHGHRALRQCFLCLRGGVTLTVAKGGKQQTVRLGHEPQAAIVGPGAWRDLSDFSEDSVVIVLASDEYDRV